MAPRKIIRQARWTVLIQCEGIRDKAFLLHLRSLYCSNGPQCPDVSVREAKGKGGNNVVDTLLGTLVGRDYNRAVAFVEADEPPDHSRMRRMKALGKRGRVVIADSCLEAMLLRIVGAKVPQTVAQCKDAAEQMAGSSLFEPREYGAIWTRERIQEHMNSDPDGPVVELISCYR